MSYFKKENQFIVYAIFDQNFGLFKRFFSFI